MVLSRHIEIQQLHVRQEQFPWGGMQHNTTVKQHAPVRPNADILEKVRQRALASVPKPYKSEVQNANRPDLKERVVEVKRVADQQRQVMIDVANERSAYRVVRDEPKHRLVPFGLLLAQPAVVNVRLERKLTPVTPERDNVCAVPPVEVP